MGKPPHPYILREIAYTEGHTLAAGEDASTYHGHKYIAWVDVGKNLTDVRVGLFEDPRDAMQAARQSVHFGTDRPYVEPVNVFQSIFHFEDWKMERRAEREQAKEQ